MGADQAAQSARKPVNERADVRRLAGRDQALLHHEQAQQREEVVLDPVIHLAQ